MRGQQIEQPDQNGIDMRSHPGFAVRKYVYERAQRGITESWRKRVDSRGIGEVMGDAEERIDYYRYEEHEAGCPQELWIFDISAHCVSEVREYALQALFHNKACS